MFVSTLENQFIYPFPKGSKLIFFALRQLADRGERRKSMTLCLIKMGDEFLARQLKS
jgi:hypothetical protein